MDAKYTLLMINLGALYLSIPLTDEVARFQTPEQLLKPYLDATLSITRPNTSSEESLSSTQTIFTLFYKQHPTPTHAISSDVKSSPLPPSGTSVPMYLPEIVDSTAGTVEVAFWRAVEQLKAAGRRPQRKGDEGKDVESPGDIDGLWPPLEYVEEENEW